MGAKNFCASGRLTPTPLPAVLGGDNQESDVDAADDINEGIGRQVFLPVWVVELGGIKGALEADPPLAGGGDGGGDYAGDGGGEKLGFAYEESGIHDRCGG